MPVATSGTLGFRNRQQSSGAIRHPANVDSDPSLVSSLADPVTRMRDALMKAILNVADRGTTAWAICHRERHSQSRSASVTASPQLPVGSNIVHYHTRWPAAFLGYHTEPLGGIRGGSERNLHVRANTSEGRRPAVSN